ncbi:hypothetical protein BsWGS_03827 [Bradybaena similaris]
MATCISASTVIILCLCADLTTLVSPPKFTNRAAKSTRSGRIEYQDTRIKSGHKHQQNDKNLIKQKPPIYTVNSKSDNLNPAANLSFEAPNITIYGQRDSNKIGPRDISVSQPMRLLRKGLSLQTEITDCSTSNKSVIKSRMNPKIRAISSTEWKDAIEESININHDERVNKHLRLQRQAAYDNPLISEHITSLVTQIPNYPKRHDSNVNEGSIGEYERCDCDNNRCDCSGRELTSVPQDLPSETRELFLNENFIDTLPTNIFSRYVFLESLSLENNYILIIEEGAFNGLTLLTSLDLSGNRIGKNNISDGIFQPLSSLKSLRLNHNGFSCITSTSYRFLTYLHNLEELYIDYYGDEDFGPEFRNMTSLRKVNVTCQPYCPLNYTRNTLFDNLRHIEQLYIPHCSILGHSVASDLFSNLTNLTTLDISLNTIGIKYLPLVMQSLKNDSLQTLIMNRITYKVYLNIITSNVTRCLPQTLTTLIARDNDVISIEANAIMGLPKRIKFIDLSDNYIIPDLAFIFVLRSLLSLEVLLLNSDNHGCFVEFTDIPPTPFWDKERKFTQALKNKPKLETQLSVLPPNLKLLQINMKKLYYVLHLGKNSLEVLDLRCSLLPEFSFTYVEQFQNLWFLNLGRSSIQTIYDADLPNLPRIEVLILESNKLNDLFSKTGFTFKGLDYLSHLDLSFNQLTGLNIDLFDGLVNLEYLRLDSNPFSHFSVNISHMGDLKLLNLSNTALPNLPMEVRSHIDHLCQTRPAQITVDMSGCPVQCDCFNLDFLKWMVGSPAFNKNFTGYKCRFSDTSLKYILDGYTEIIHDLSRECAKNYPVFVLILGVTLILLCAVTGTIIYRFRWKIKYLYYAAYLNIVNRQKNENIHEFTHDVFISYDSQDQEFAMRCLAPELENRGLKLLLHTRDFVAGTYIASNIVMAVAESRKTLVVLTRNLLESTWCNYEIQMATMEAVHTGRPVLVFLLKENIPNRELDVELLRYIKSNTYLPYPGPEEEGDEEIMKKFYDKLAHDLKC